VLFFFLSVIFTQLALILPHNYTPPLIVFAVIGFISTCVFIINTSEMYFTDRIFIIILNLALFAKTLTFTIDHKRLKERHPSTHAWVAAFREKNVERFSVRLLFLVSPYPVYHTFVQQYNPNLPIHLRYLLTKLWVSGLCLVVNNTLIVRFIEPACGDPGLSFIALCFKLVPLAFYINMLLYYMVMDNIIAALAELTKVENRLFYLDWWNATTVY
jgi:hypothetical protein